MKTVKADILIIGVGSSGYGALYNALRLSSGKYRVIAVDRNPGFGGTSTFGGVNNWEPGPGGLGIHSRLASDLLNIPLAACIGNSNGSGLDERVRW